MASYDGTCFCGAVELTFTGDVMAEIICHCKLCRAAQSASLATLILFPYDHDTIDATDKTLQITKGAENLGCFNLTGRVQRYFCKTCSAGLFNIRPDMKFVACFPTVLKTFPFEPKMHVHYGSKIMSIKDGLPKYKDTPGALKA